MPYELVQSPLQADLKQAADDLRDGVHSGLIVGLAVTVHLRRHRFFVDVFGEVTRDPHWGRAACLSLDDCLREISYRRKNSFTTR